MIDVPTLRKLGTDPSYAPPATFANACVDAADTIDELARCIDGSVRVAADALATVKRLEAQIGEIRGESTKLLDFIDNEGPCAKEWEAITATGTRLRELLA